VNPSPQDAEVREPPGARPAASPLARWAWGAGAFLLAIAVAAASDALGRSSRVLQARAPAGAGRRASVVKDASGAFHAWAQSGVRGRVVVVLTGRWSRPAGAGRHPPPSRGEPIRSDATPVDVDSALFAAAEAGIARSYEVVMPREAFARHVGEASGRKGAVTSDGSLSLPNHGLERRFSRTDTFVPPREPVLVLVEPSFLDEGSPPDPAAWLAARGAVVDLLIVALEDPAATPAQLVSARRLADALGASAPGDGR
jgi:hypothetical protein